MDSLLNTARPPVFCPGCGHERITRALDRALTAMGLSGDRVVIVSDIGCSGLFDTFFNTHAMHGLHGRALTYATGLKLARPDLTVIVTMGDGGQGIGGAHLLAACRRNLDLTLLVLNNFNFGMTGGQYSATTPPDAVVGSGFLNRLEQPLDVCRVALAAGAPYVTRCSGYEPDLAVEIESAVRFVGFSVIDMWGVCPGRYTRKNPLSPKSIEEKLSRLPALRGPVPENSRAEYGARYREITAGLQPVTAPSALEKRFDPPEPGRQDIVLLGSAGQRILTAGEIVCLAGMAAGLCAAQKSEYNITVLRGPSISDLILSPEPVGYSGIGRPGVVLALAREGVERRESMFARIDKTALVIRAADVAIPPCAAKVIDVDMKALSVKGPDRALAALAVLAKTGRAITPEMLAAAVSARFRGPARDAALDLVSRMQAGT
jgi:2-oxoglutarate/2-oxoacid ferredoxin oxidoreductase subunit beta